MQEYLEVDERIEAHILKRIRYASMIFAVCVSFGFVLVGWQVIANGQRINEIAQAPSPPCKGTK